MNLSFLDFNFKKYVFSFLTAFIVTVIIEALASFVFAYLKIPSGIIEAVHDYSSYFSAFLAAFLCAMKCGKRGFLTGMISAILYIAFLMAIGGLVFKSSVNIAEIIKLLPIYLICGAIGGIAGINCK